MTHVPTIFQLIYSELYEAPLTLATYVGKPSRAQLVEKITEHQKTFYYLNPEGVDRDHVEHIVTCISAPNVYRYGNEGYFVDPILPIVGEGEDNTQSPPGTK